MINNTSIIQVWVSSVQQGEVDTAHVDLPKQCYQDEVLAHRLGLVPLLIDPALVEFKSPEEATSEKNTVIFKIDVSCKRSGDKVINDKGKSASVYHPNISMQVSP